jgi:hypothetical protein
MITLFFFSFFYPEMGGVVGEWDLLSYDDDEVVEQRGRQKCVLLFCVLRSVCASW